MQLLVAFAKTNLIESILHSNRRHTIRRRRLLGPHCTASTHNGIILLTGLANECNSRVQLIEYHFLNPLSCLFGSLLLQLAKVNLSHKRTTEPPPVTRQQYYGRSPQVSNKQRTTTRMKSAHTHTNVDHFDLCVCVCVCVCVFAPKIGSGSAMPGTN
jgi:hypothetical protein